MYRHTERIQILCPLPIRLFIRIRLLVVKFDNQYNNLYSCHKLHSHSSDQRSPFEGLHTAPPPRFIYALIFMFSSFHFFQLPGEAGPEGACTPFMTSQYYRTTANSPFNFHQRQASIFHTTAFGQGVQAPFRSSPPMRFIDSFPHTPLEQIRATDYIPFHKTSQNLTVFSPALISDA